MSEIDAGMSKCRVYREKTMERESLLSRQQKKKTLGCSHGMSWLCQATSMEMVTFHVFFSAQNWV